jgi:light-regulated signal transduction histidine kinase (bacteriophytochrome)
MTVEMKTDLAHLQAENHRLNDELAQAKSALNRLTFTVQHDLRAPLRHIGAFVKVIEEDHGTELSAPVLAHLKVIEEAAATATKIVDELHGASKPA